MQRQGFTKSKGKGKGKKGKAEELVLGTLNPKNEPFSGTNMYRGIIVSRVPYNPTSRSFSFTLAPIPEASPQAKKMDVQLKGEWARIAEEKLKGAQRVCFMAAGGRMAPAPKRPDDEEGWQAYKIIYQHALQGWLFDKDNASSDFHVTARDGENNSRASTSAVVRTLGQKDTSHSSGNNSARPSTSFVAPPTTADSSTSALPSAPLPRAPPQAPETRPAPAPPAQFTSTVPVAPVLPSYRSASPTGLAPSAQDQDAEMADEEGRVAGQKRRISEPGAGARATKKQKAVIRKWELEVIRSDREDFVAKKLGGKIKYTPLDKLERDDNQRGVCLIAVALVSNEARKANGGGKDWTITLRLRDATRPDELVTCVMFAPSRECLPIPEAGDVVVLQDLNWSKSSRNFTGYVGKARSLVLSSDALLSLADGTTTAQSLLKMPLNYNRVASCKTEEVEYARDLVIFMAEKDKPVEVEEETGPKLSAKEKSALIRKGGSAGRPTLTVAEMSADAFCDTFLWIVRAWTGGAQLDSLDKADSITLHCTDFTVNDQLFDTLEGQVVGQRILSVSVFGSQAKVFAGIDQDTIKGKFIKIRNLRCKINKEGFLEGTVWPDEKYPGKRDIEVITSNIKYPEVYRAIIERQKAYREEEKGLLAPNFGDSAAAVASTNADAKAASSIYSPRRPSDPIAQLSSVLSLNIPGIYHVRARVVDYSPSRIEDWIVAYCSLCGARILAGCLNCLDHSGPIPPPQVTIQAFFTLRDESLSPDAEGLLLQLTDGPGSTLLPDIELSLDTRDASTASFAALQARVAPVLGSLEACKRRKRTPTSIEECGEEAVMTLVAKKPEGETELRWSWSKGMEFRAPQA